MGGWREEWETRGYRRRLSGSAEDFLRVRMRIERGQLRRFTAQYEAVFDGRTYPVVRYDTAHSGPHRDTLDWQGRVVAKDWLREGPYGDVLDDATNDIDRRWRTYRSEFERRRP